jgi:hypothetical protein
LLAKIPTGNIGDTEEAFYRLRDFHVREEQPKLTFPPNIMISDNFFRPRWVGVGDRKLKNVSLIMEWIPEASKHLLQQRIQVLFQQLTVGCGTPNCPNIYCRSCDRFVPDPDPNSTAAKALQLVMPTLGFSTLSLNGIFCNANVEKLNKMHPNVENMRFVVAVSLAEGETLRRIIHSKQEILQFAAIALRTVQGHLIDASPNFWPEIATNSHPTLVEMAVQSFRFFNCEMYFLDRELDVLEIALRGSPLDKRLQFFLENLRLRRRERNLWGDTPIAKIFLPREEWHLLRYALYFLKGFLTDDGFS